VAASGLIFVVALVVIRLVTNLAEPGLAAGAAGDFRDATYFPARALLDGVNPYDPTAYLDSNPDIGQYFPLYGPHHLILHLPFTALSLNTAIAVYGVLTLILTVTLAWVGLRLAGLDRTGPVVLGTSALLLASNPGRANFVSLQPTILIVLGAYLALSYRNTSWMAAAGAALTFLKPQFGIPLVVILFFTGRASIARRGILIATIVSAPVIARLIDIENGIGGVFKAVKNNLQYSTDLPAGGLQINLIDSFDVTSAGASIVTAAVILFAAIVALRSHPPVWVGVTITASAILLALFHVNYDLLLLTWPTLAAAAAWNGERRRLHLVLLLLLLALMFNPLTSSFGITNLGLPGLFGALSGVVLLCVFGVSIAVGRQPGGASPTSPRGM
jgi:hypothetical protein